MRQLSNLHEKWHCRFCACPNSWPQPGQKFTHCLRSSELFVLSSQDSHTLTTFFKSRESYEMQNWMYYQVEGKERRVEADFMLNWPHDIFRRPLHMTGQIQASMWCMKWLWHACNPSETTATCPSGLKHDPCTLKSMAKKSMQHSQAE